MKNLDPLTSGQLGAINNTVGRYAQSRCARLWMIGQLVGRPIESTAQLTWPDWKKFRDAAYPNWRESMAMYDEWPEIDPTFARTLAQLARRYEEEVNGQLTLF